MEFTRLRTCLPLFQTHLAPSGYIISDTREWPQSVKAMISKSVGPYILASVSNDMKKDEPITVHVLWVQTCHSSDQWLGPVVCRISCGEKDKGLADTDMITNIAGEQLDGEETLVYEIIFSFLWNSIYWFCKKKKKNSLLCIVKCQMDLKKWKNEAVCKRSSCEKRKLRPLISCVSICSRTGRPNHSAAIRNQPNSPSSHPCPHDTLFHEPPPPTFLSAQAPGPLWVNLTQPWPENRVVSYSSNPLLSHHAIKYALQPLTSQVRETPPPSSNTALPTPTKGPIK